MASFLEDVRFYNRNIAREYKEYCSARESREVEREKAACGLVPTRLPSFGARNGSRLPPLYVTTK